MNNKTIFLIIGSAVLAALACKYCYDLGYEKGISENNKYSMGGDIANAAAVLLGGMIKAFA